MPQFKVVTTDSDMGHLIDATFYQTDENWVNFYEGIGMDKQLLASFPARVIVSVFDPAKVRTAGAETRPVAPASPAGLGLGAASPPAGSPPAPQGASPRPGSPSGPGPGLPPMAPPGPPPGGPYGQPGTGPLPEPGSNPRGW